MWGKRCNHKWIKQTDTILESGFEQLAKCKLAELERAGGGLFVKTHVLVLSCSECGELDKTVTRSGRGDR